MLLQKRMLQITSNYDFGLGQSNQGQSHFGDKSILVFNGYQPVNAFKVWVCICTPNCLIDHHIPHEILILLHWFISPSNQRPFWVPHGPHGIRQAAQVLKVARASSFCSSADLEICQDSTSWNRGIKTICYVENYIYIYKDIIWIHLLVSGHPCVNETWMKAESVGIAWPWVPDQGEVSKFSPSSWNLEGRKNTCCPVTQNKTNSWSEGEIISNGSLIVVINFLVILRQRARVSEACMDIIYTIYNIKINI